jgi:hypothetical protein
LGGSVNNVYLKAIQRALDTGGLGYRLVCTYIVLKNQAEGKLGKSYWRFMSADGEFFRAWDFDVALVVSGKGVYCFLVESIMEAGMTFNNVKAALPIDVDKFKFDKEVLLKLEIKE